MGGERCVGSVVEGGRGGAGPADGRRRVDAGGALRTRQRRGQRLRHLVEIVVGDHDRDGRGGLTRDEGERAGQLRAGRQVGGLDAGEVVVDRLVAFGVTGAGDGEGDRAVDV